MELLGPRSETPGAHAADPCPYPSCRQDLSVGRTFECRRCNNTVHAWHRSQANPELCERCHEAVRQGRTRVVAAVVILLALGGGVYGLWHVARGEKYVDPLALHWYGSGQRYEDGGWREFTLQNGITMYDGDEFRLTFIPNADCYVCVLCINSNGEVTQLFPNPAIRQGSSCQRGQVYEVPDGVNWFALDDQPGTETLFLVASYGSLKDLEDRLKQVVEGSLSQDAPRTVASAVQMIESRNEPDSDGQIRTTSGIVVRNVKIKPSRQVTTVGLKSGEQVERVMEFVQGRAGVVQRIQFVHLRAPESL